MNWKSASVSNAISKYIFLGVMPTIMVILLLSLLPDIIGSRKNVIFIASFLLLSLPHFILSIQDFALHRNEEISFQLTSKREHILYLISLILWVISFIYFDDLLMLIPLTILLAYQSRHYAMQSYGIFRYFKGSNTYQILFVTLGFIFLFNLLLHSLKEAHLFKITTIQLIEKILLIIQGTLFLLTSLNIIFFNKPKLKEDYIQNVTLLIWFIWTYLSKDILFILFLPILHSLQYLPFFQMKLVSRGREQGRLWKYHAIINLLALALSYVIFILDISPSAQKILLTLAIAINMIHIHVDSYLWKSHEV